MAPQKQTYVLIRPIKYLKNSEPKRYTNKTEVHVYKRTPTQVHSLNDKLVCLVAFKQVTHGLGERSLARVPIGTIDGDEDIGICAGTTDISCLHHHLILHCG